MVVLSELEARVAVEVGIAAELVVRRIEVDEVSLRDVGDAQLKVLVPNLYILEDRCHGAEVVRVIVAPIVGAVRHVELTLSVHTKESTEAGLVEKHEVCCPGVKVQ